MILSPEYLQLPKTAWQQRADEHRKRADRHTLQARARRDRGMPDPVEDFLFQYYPYPISVLENWHPGHGLALEWSEISGALPSFAHFTERHYSMADGFLAADPEKLSEKERQRLVWITELLEATQNRSPNFACHGLHEWAMVYGGTDIRHEETTPLRLSQTEIDAFVESRVIACSHHDAFRFFSKAAKPMNRIQPTLDTRVALEQPGCVHANMDLYKWAAKAMPWIGTELLLDCFELAMELRDLDMRASPYDLRASGREPICIETAEGRRIYETEQRRLALSSSGLRTRLIDGLKRIHG